MKFHKKHTIKKHEIGKVTRTKRGAYHRIIHKVHYKHRLSYRTIFYMKEYGPKSHVTFVIVNESIKIIFVASVISAIGGIHLQNIKDQIISIVPLLILLPAMNDMVGDFGTILSSKFTTMLYLGQAPTKWWSQKGDALHELLFTIFLIGVISSIYIAFLSYGIATLRGFPFDAAIMVKILSISVLATTALIGIIALISIGGGLYIFHKKEDPNNFLIPLTTAISDLGSMAIFSVMVAAMF